MEKDTHVHFVGIGGIGMSAIAQMLVNLGHTVSGSDIRATSITRQLENMGIHVYYGHAPDNLNGCHCVVYSSSIDPQNPELKEARAQGLVIHHRSQMLASLSADKWTAAVSGTHGKSTTSSLLGWVYERCGKNPTVLVGAKVDQLGGNFRMGTGPSMIVEADESDASFLEYNPDAIIVTNIDNDHLDYFKGMDDIYYKFRLFLQRLKPHGRWYGCSENEHVCRLLKDEPRGAVSYGWGPGNDYVADQVEFLGEKGSRFVLYGRGRRIGEVSLSIFGRHNVLNATAVCAMALDQGMDFSSVRDAVWSYRGAGRRFEIAMNTDDLILIDDYAHHPTEIEATLEAARHFSKRRLVVVFQPHRYTRAKFLEDDLTKCFGLADELIVTDIYGAGEKPIEGVSGERLAGRIEQARGKATSFIAQENLTVSLLGRLNSGDMVLMMGAGDIGEMVHEVRKSAEVYFSIGTKDLARGLQRHCQGRLRFREPLKPHTSIKIGGPAECWFEPEDNESLAQALRIARETQSPVHVLGGGSNVLISDEGLEGLILHLSSPSFKKLYLEGDEIIAGGGVALSNFIQFLMENGRGECEFLMGIPAQVGGSVMMNAGSGHQWLGSYLVRLTAVDFKGDMVQKRREEIAFGYRSSGLKDLVVVEAAFRFPKVPLFVTQKNLSEYAAYRRRTQELRYASAGCMFRNPEGVKKSAGELVDEAGLKGTRIGQAQVSEIHGNFVVNLGGARHRDVLEIIRLAEEKVGERFGVHLQREIKILP